jgi:hypothetical protein
MIKYVPVASSKMRMMRLGSVLPVRFKIESCWGSLPPFSITKFVAVWQDAVEAFFYVLRMIGK